MSATETNGTLSVHLTNDGQAELNGTLTVASRVVFEHGQPAKKHYRRYRIKEAPPDDDYACLREVIGRRLARVGSEPLPDLVMVDGGKGQLSVVTTALADAGLEVDCLGLSKLRDDDGAQPRVRRLECGGGEAGARRANRIRGLRDRAAPARAREQVGLLLRKRGARVRAPSSLEEGNGTSGALSPC